MNIDRCDDQRSIALTALASKVILHILVNQTGRAVEPFVGPDQFGFKKGMGPCEAIGIIRA